MPTRSTQHSPELMDSELHAIKGVEIFSTGLWNGKQIKEEDLDSIVYSYAKTEGKVRPFLKLGHSNEQALLKSEGLPAAGWVENVRRSGSKLVADFVDIPKKIYQLIKNKAYRKVSCEIYNNMDIEGEKFPRLLGAVALLGAELPGVLNLKDILSNYSLPGDFVTIEKFATDETPELTLIQSSNLSTEKDAEQMGDENVETFKVKLADAEQALSAKDAEIEKYKQEAEAAKAEAAKHIAEKAALAAQAKAAQVDAFVTEVSAEKLCTPAMAPLVKALVGEDKETYSMGSKELSKFELVKQVLKFSQEAAKVNFSETTKDEQSADKIDLNTKVETYAAEHKISYRDAYVAVTKDMELKAKPLSGGDTTEA